MVTLRHLKVTEAAAVRRPHVAWAMLEGAGGVAGIVLARPEEIRINVLGGVEFRMDEGAHGFVNEAWLERRIDECVRIAKLVGGYAAQ